MKITIFGLAGTGTSTVGKLLASKLGFSFLSAGDVFRKKASDLGLTLLEFHNLAVDDPSIDKECDQEIKEYGEKNTGFVVESRLSWHFVPDSIKVRLFADSDERISRVAKRDGQLFKLAKESIAEREANDAERYRKFYGIDNIDDPTKFDLNIDTTSTPAEAVVDKIIEFVNNK